MKRSCFPSLLMSLLLMTSVLGQLENPAQKARKAQEALGAGRFDEATRLYSELVSAFPDVPGLKMNLGLAYYFSGTFQKAEGLLAEAASKDPSLDTAWLFLGASRLELKKPQAAADALQRYVKMKPNQPDGWQMMGDALLAAEKFDEAVSNFEKTIELNPKNPRGWYGLGRTYEGISTEAFERLEKEAPESGYWLALVAASRVAQQQNGSAFYFYRKALEKQPDLRGIHVALSRIYRATGHEDWASQEEEKEIELGLPNCEVEKSVCAFLEGKPDEVMRLTRGVGTAEALYWRTQAANQLAVSAFSKLEEFPRSFELHQLKAEIHRNQGRHWESVKEWRRALELSPGNHLARQELALSLYLNRDYDSSREIVNELLKQEPGSSQLNFLAGDSLLYQQEVERSIPFLEKALRSDPTYKGAHSSLGRAYMHVGEAAQAIPHLKAALSVDRDGSLHYQLARAYQRTGEHHLAREIMSKYQEIKKTLSATETQLKEEVKISAPE